MRFLNRASLLIVVLILVSCSLQSIDKAPPPAAPTSSHGSAPEASVPAETVSTTGSAWQEIQPGMHMRSMLPGGDRLAEIIAIRIDPALFTFRAHYRPGQPLDITGWQEYLPGAAVIINANFFDPENRIVGLLISDGIVHGWAYTDRGGMFAVQNGIPRIRSNTADPYQGEAIEQAVQAFPMLVQDGVAAYTNPEDTRVRRRTAIGQDVEGSIIFMVTPVAGMSLPDFSAFLASSDLNLVNAFNLDGGGSTMMYASDGAYLLRSFEPVPAVLAAYPRQ
ncbi:MAG: phosphodiester glycosidase family protein [Chloroflexota bacterium]